MEKKYTIKSTIKLELKHIIPYLPHQLKCMLMFDMTDDFAEEDWVTDNEIFSEGSIWTYGGYCDDDLCIPLGEGDFSGLLIRRDKCYASIGKAVKPILRPLSDFTGKKTGDDVIKMLDCKVYQVHELWDFANGEKELNQLTLGLYEVMNKNHLDYNNLINQGLALDMNTLEDELIIDLD